ncbi:two-component system, NarL family, sensor histidine kinase DegS [Mesobacillus persicus]|uniref:Signal transduction histidine-protein kinase/phosphatase DegS n=1 Tax=Mesobacillus persicus TaxID=930146 RepID=A0A1H8A3N5_9BACI|nr:sensor histidine kinase [Mesobacillus persicus]SEM65355.1 two-component system, NarL family, sensor histidine kinase DegS [Mesobacillus persicus]
MVLKKIETKTLDHILETMIDTVVGSKKEVFSIGEQCRQDYESIMTELKEVKQLGLKNLEEGDKLEDQVRSARKRLSDVSKCFKDYSEAEVRDAYEVAHTLQMELTIKRQMEKQLKVRREELEHRLIGLTNTIDRAGDLASQISVVMNYMMSDIRQMGKALETAKQKQDFGLKIIEAQEEERKRLSREIHDGPAQMLAHVMMRSDLIEKIYKERSGEEAIDEIRNLKVIVRSALYEVRRIIYDLRPMALDDLGLVPTLKKYLQTIEDYHKTTKIQFSNLGEAQRLPAKYEVALFRLIQESVSNALKHAEASYVNVELEITKDMVKVVTKDNGKGFDVNTKKMQSFGILGMKERVELLDGEIFIDSTIGNGTQVIVQVPIS